MNKALQRLIAALRDSRGATAVEYGLIVALVVLVMLVGLSALSDSNSVGWNHLKDRVVEATA